MHATLAERLTEDRIEFDELHRRYRPLLSLVDVLIGVVPNCDRYLEIWPPGFRTYNLMVPNFLNLPASLLGAGAPKDVVGLAMYASSRAASCAYCSAHTCSFALRRGSSDDALTGVSRTPGERAAVAVAESLSTVPHGYTPGLGHALREHFSADDAEWIVMGVAMMGFLNKFMDAVGVELEPEAIDDVAALIGPTGWAIGQHGWADGPRHGGANGVPSDGDGAAGPPVDSLATLLRVFRAAPGALRLDRRWMRDVPKEAKRVRRFVADTSGYDEPLLERLRHARPRRALAAMLRDNLDPGQSELGIGTKALVGLSFATFVGNDHLAERNAALASAHGVDPAAIRAAIESSGAAGSGASTELDDATTAAIALARAMAPSPAAVDRAEIERACTSLSSAEIVELAVWVSLCQLLHRLAVYFEIDRVEKPAPRHVGEERPEPA